VPFLVLNQAMVDAAKNPCEYTNKILRLVLEVCTNLLAKNTQFKQEIVKLVNGFIRSPSNRTADVVASVQVLTAQLLSFQELT
jgi:hypothetical protein